MPKGFCSSCNVKGIATRLTEDNCPPSVFKSQFGGCKSCNAKASAACRVNNPGSITSYSKEYRRLHRQELTGFVKKYLRTFKGRHISLRSKIRKESLPETDLLLSFNFYAELIRDNECHYCLGPLNPTSHGLDCKDNEIGHRCFNVVPCCKSCNQKKMNDTTYEEMMLLSPALKEIMKRRKEHGSE